MTAETSEKRIVVEVDRDTRDRLKLVAAKRRLTMKQLLAELSQRAEREAFAQAPGAPQ